MLTVPVAKHAPKTLTPEQVQRLLDACLHLRDRFLLALALRDDSVSGAEAFTSTNSFRIPAFS